MPMMHFKNTWISLLTDKNPNSFMLHNFLILLHISKLPYLTCCLFPLNILSHYTKKSIKPLKMFAPAHGSSIWTKGWHMATQPTNTQNAKEMDLLAPLALFSMVLLWFKILQDKDNPFLKPVLSGIGNYQV